MVIDEATDRFAPLFKPVESDIGIFKEYCEECFDKIIADQDVEAFTCEVDEDTMDVSVILEMFTLESGDPNSPVQKLMHVAKSFRVTNPDGENVKVTFTFPPLWEKA
jgi:hypothetical protein